MSPTATDPTQPEENITYLYRSSDVRLIIYENDETRENGNALRKRQEKSNLVDRGSDFIDTQAEPRNTNHPPKPAANKLDKNTKHLVDNTTLKKERTEALQKLNEMLEDKYQATVAFMAALEGNELEFREPENITYLRDDPEFRAFVTKHLWRDRGEHGWKRRSDVFEYVATTFADFFEEGLARSSFSGLDDELLQRINAKTYENRKDDLYLPDGTPPTLHLPKRETGKASTPEDMMMLAMAQIYDLVHNYRMKEYRDSNKLESC